MTVLAVRTHSIHDENTEVRFENEDRPLVPLVEARICDRGWMAKAWPGAGEVSITRKMSRPVARKHAHPGAEPDEAELLRRRAKNAKDAGRASAKALQRFVLEHALVLFVTLTWRIESVD